MRKTNPITKTVFDSFGISLILSPNYGYIELSGPGTAFPELTVAMKELATIPVNRYFINLPGLTHGALTNLLIELKKSAQLIVCSGEMPDGFPVDSSVVFVNHPSVHQRLQEAMRELTKKYSAPPDDGIFFEDELQEAE